MRTFVEAWWDEDVRRRRPVGMQPIPPSMLLMGVCSKLGTAHELNLSQPWMQWQRVFDQLVKLQLPKIPESPASVQDPT